MTSYPHAEANAAETNAAVHPEPVQQPEDPRIVFLRIQFVLGIAIGLLLVGYQLEGRSGMNTASVVLAALAFLAVGNPDLQSELSLLCSAGMAQMLKATGIVCLELGVAGIFSGPIGMTVCALTFPLSAVIVWHMRPKCFPGPPHGSKF